MKKEMTTERTMVSKHKLSTKALTRTALLAALIAVLSQISLPMPTNIPLTLQTFAVGFAGYFGGLFGLASVLIFLLLGLCGVPVFANFKGGIGAFAGLTGGFLIGFIPLVLACCIRCKTDKPVLRTLIRTSVGTVGLILCHVAGVAWFSFQSGNGFWQSALLVSVPYFVKDVLSLVGATMLADVLNRRLNYAQN